RAKQGEQRRMSGQEPEIAFGSRNLDFIDLFADQRPLGRDDVELEVSWQWQSSVLTVVSFLGSLPLRGPLDDLFNRTDHVEVLLRNLVVFSFDDLLEPTNRVGDPDVFPFESGELLGDEKRLR